MNRESPGGRMGGDATAGFQDVAGDRQFVGGGADVPERVMQDEVFEMHEFTIDPERGVRLEEMRALEKALALASKYDCGVAVADPDDCWRPGWGALEGRSLEAVE